MSGVFRFCSAATHCVYRISTSSSCSLFLRNTSWIQGSWLSRCRNASSLISPQNILSSPFPDKNLPEVSLAEYLFPRFDSYSDLRAVTDFSSGKSYTFGQLKDAVIRVASALTRHGFNKGDVLTVVSTNRPEYTILFLAASCCGIVVSPANPAYTSGELVRQLKLSQARIVCAEAALLQTVKEAIASDRDLHDGVKKLIAFGKAEGCKPFESLLEDDGKSFPENVSINPREDVLTTPFSSGTTGLPKGVMLTHYNCVSNLIQSREQLSLDSSVDSVMGILPFFHIYGMSVVQFASLQDGCQVVTHPRFDPETFLKSIKSHKISILHTVPPIVMFMARHPSVNQYDLSSLRKAFCGAASLGQGLTEEFEDRIKIPVYQGYGLSETSPVINIDVAPGHHCSVGMLIPNTKGKIVNPENGSTLEVGETGEYCIKGPQIMKGYLNNDLATKEMIDAEGWLHTGDLGYIRRDGLVVIEDRLKELIKYKGFQVPPSELEHLLLTHPSIQDTAVIGIPSDETGELPMAYVVKIPGAILTESDVLKFVEDNVAAHKKLRGGVKFVAKIPKSSSGKILRRLLKAAIYKS